MRMYQGLPPAQGRSPLQPSSRRAEAPPHLPPLLPRSAPHSRPAPAPPSRPHHTHHRTGHGHHSRHHNRHHHRHQCGSSGRMSESSSRSKQSQSQVLDNGSHINDELRLSEDSDEEEQGNGSSGGSTGRTVGSGGAFGTPQGHHQSSMGSAANNITPLSPISPKSSDESSTSEDSSDDSEMSSNNSTDEELVESSPKHPENKSDVWKLDNFMPFRKTNSPMSVAGAGAGPQRAEEQQPQDAKEPLPPQPRERTERKAAKNTAAGGGSHHGSRGGQEGRGWGKLAKAGLYEDSSGEEQPHPRPIPRVSAEVRQTPKHGRDPPGRPRLPKAKPPPSRQFQDSDSDSDAPPPRKSQPAAKAAPQDTEKSPKVSVAPPPREAPKKFPRKRSDSRKGSHSGAKSESSRGRQRRREFQSQETVYDSDSDHSLDVTTTATAAANTTAATATTTTTSPDKAVGRGTPSRSAWDASRTMASPLKPPPASPHVSPRVPPITTKAKRVAAAAAAGLGSDSPVSKSEDEPESLGQASSQRPEAARASSSSSSGGSKGALVSRAFSAAAKKDRAGRDQEAAEAKKKAKGEVQRPGGGANRRDRSDKSVRGRATAEASVAAVAAAAAAPAPSPARRASKSPVGSAEPKVPIPQVQFVDGYPRLTCTIALSFIDKVPKPCVSGGGGGGSGSVPPFPVNNVKSEVKVKVEEEDEEDDEEEEEEEVEERSKAVLDNRTKEGKGKRKASEPGGTKATAQDESKRKIIFSIFGNVKRQDHESDDDKVKREVKKEEEEEEEEEDSEEERGGRSSSLRPTATTTTTIKQEPGEATPARQSVLASPRSPVSDTSMSRQHRKKKQERLSPSRERKRPKKGSDRHPQDSLSLPGGGGGSSAEGRGRRDGSVETTRKRPHDRDSSLESTRSTSRTNSESGESHSKKARISKSLGTPDPMVAASPSSTRAASQRSADDTHHSWPQEKDDTTAAQLKHSQKPQHSQQSSQYSHKGFNGLVEESSLSQQEVEYTEEVDTSTTPSQRSTTTTTTTTHPRLCGKDKADESGSTPCGDSSGYTTSRPVSEHESRVNYRAGEQGAKVPESEAPWHPGNLAAPHGQRLPGPSTTPNTTATATLPPSRPAGDQALLHGHYANQQERQYTPYFERRIPEINRDYNCYLNRAKQLKHIADEETDRSMQAMKYLEAALYFILSGKAMETDHDASASLTMYKDTLHFIKWVSSVFRRENQEGSINAKLAVISLRCQSLLSLKIYQMRRFEHKDTQRQLHKYFQNFSKSGNIETSGGNGQQWGGQRGAGSPSHPSQTPSPAGSVGSEGSQSSGYTTSTEGRSKAGASAPPVGHTPPHPQPPQGAHASVSVVSVPVNIHTLIMKQNCLSSHLASAHDMWMEADEYVSKNNIKDFFDELDHQASPLTLHSSLPELVMYVQCGLHRIKA